jgi:hypothetical protein
VNDKLMSELLGVLHISLTDGKGNLNINEPKRKLVLLMNDTPHE